MKIPMVSIIVPIYNVERYLHLCLNSIVSQTFTDFECILVDDCSPDNCFEICDEYAEKDKRIKIIRNKNNMGPSLSRKIGFENSQGTYIQFVDSDDWIEKDMIKKLYEEAISKNYDIVTCDCFYEKEGVRKIIEQKFSGFDKVTMIKDILAIRISTYVCNKLVKRDLFSLVQFPEDSRSEDYVITIQNICNSTNVGYVNVPLYNYRYNEESLSNNIRNKINGYIEENRNWRKLICILKEKYENMKIFEPELSNRINIFREIYMLDDDLKKIDELNELFILYPKTNFCRWKIIKKVKKMVLKLKGMLC